MAYTFMGFLFLIVSGVALFFGLGDATFYGTLILSNLYFATQKIINAIEEQK